MKTEKLALAVNDIDEELILKAESPAKRRPRCLRYAAAAAALLLIFGAAFGVAKAEREGGVRAMRNLYKDLPEGYEFMSELTVPKDAVQPESSAYYGGSSSEYERSYTFREAYQEAYAVCAVSIGDYIGRNEWSTDYNATVERIYKGDLPEEITVCQYVHGKRPTPFHYGDKLLLFLRESRREGYTNAYEVVGADIAQMYLAAAHDGSVYAIDFCGLMSLASYESDEAGYPHNLSELIVDGYPDPENAEQTENGKALLRELAEYLAKTDPGLDGAYMCYVFEIGEIERLFAEFE